MNQQIADALKQDVVRRICEENIPRMKKCLSLLNQEQVWHQPNENIPSIGNLVLHSCGNARQWIIHGIAGEKDVRERNKEFATTGLNKEELEVKLDTLKSELRPTVNSFSEAQLLKEYEIQCFKENGVAVLVHVAEHFSYHTGQISTLTKLALDTDLGYYSSLKLD